MTQTVQPPQTMQGGRPLSSHRRETIASLFGEPSYERIDWRRLIQDGVLVRLHIRRCRFSTRLVLEDLGVHVEDATVREKLSRWLILGEKRLLPVAYMKGLSHIESSARYALKERSFRTELGAFVPSSAYLAWREATEELKREYLALRDDILANHRALSRQVLEEYEVIAADTYQRLRGTHPELVRETQAEFVMNYCHRITSHIPSPDRIRETFDFTYLLIDGLSQLGTAQDGSAVQSSSNITVQEDPATTIDHARAQAQQREWQRSVLQHDLRRHAQEQVDLALESFLSGVLTHVRNLTYNVACDVLTTLQRRGGEQVAHQSVRQLSHLLAQIRELNFYGDTEIDRMMERIQEIVDQSPKARQHSIGEIEQTLRAIATVTRSTLLDLEEEPRMAREIGLADLPTQTAVRQARAELGLDLEMAQFASVAHLRAEARTQRAEISPAGMHTLWSTLSEEVERGARVV